MLVTVLTLGGDFVTTSKGGTDAGRITHQVDVGNLPAGTYFSVVRTFSQRETKPFIITK